MRNKNKEKSRWQRLFRAIASFTLLFSVFYLMVAGFSIIATALLMASIVAVAYPAIAAAESVLEGVVGFVEVFVEGFLAVFEIIGDIFGSIFG